MTDHVHEWLPLERVRAAYRCRCGAMGYKPNIRTTVGPKNHIEPYKCTHTGCPEPVIVLYQTIRGVRRHKPSCALHRKG